jgi:FtsP/CotA-like multicopper oxidase with cupredoxin domain
MKTFLKQQGRLLGALILGLGLALPAQQAQAAGHDIRGITPDTTSGKFELYAFPFNMNLPDGSSVYMWGFGDMQAGTNPSPASWLNPVSGAVESGAGYNLPQYPAPTLIVNQGDTVTIEMTNYGVPDPVNLVVTGHNVSASCVSGAGTCTEGLLGLASAPPGTTAQTVSYSFIAGNPGTYIYHSLDGANPGLHKEMGLTGALIVRPTDGGTPIPGTVYGSGTPYDHEYLYFLTEIDPGIHLQMERGHVTHFSQNDRYATIWFVNGRVFPDLFQGDFNDLFPYQPYQSLALATPHDEVLVRHVNGGSDAHPFHYHGENWYIVGRDGRLLSTDIATGGNNATANLGRSDNTINSQPNQAVDLLWTWTGKNLGWDIYGSINGRLANPLHEHDCIDGNFDGFGDVSAGSTHEGEWCDDHYAEFPVDLPGVQDLTLGGWWSGSPFLGDTGGLPPGEGGLNPFGGYFFVWHSHAEKELTTDDIFPGGSLSAVVILPPSLKAAIQ